MKKIMVVDLLFSMAIHALQKDDIVFIGKGATQVQIPAEQLALVCDENDSVLWGSVALSGLGLVLTGLYRLVVEPAPFDLSECRTSYYLALFNQSHETRYPCDWKSEDFSDCLSKLTAKFCDVEQAQYDKTIPEKKFMAWIPLITVATASVSFQASWLFGKWLGHKMNIRRPFKARTSIAIEMEDV